MRQGVDERRGEGPHQYSPLIWMLLLFDPFLTLIPVRTELRLILPRRVIEPSFLIFPVLLASTCREGMKEFE